MGCAAVALRSYPASGPPRKAVLSFHKVRQPFVIGRQIAIALTQIEGPGWRPPFRGNEARPRDTAQLDDGWDLAPPFDPYRLHAIRPDPRQLGSLTGMERGGTRREHPPVLPDLPSVT
jgi:hypothetical protein